MAIDSVDGSLARAARVHEIVPRVDGRRLDDIVDYLNYVIVAAVFMVAAGREHHSWGWITVANALLGWTGIGWCLVLAWAWYSPANEQAPAPHLRLVHSDS